MAEVWSTVNLSSDTKEASLALAHLRRVLPAELSENEEVTSALENLESKVSRLLSPPSSFHPNPAAPVQNIAKRAHETLWDQVPLHAMANAYKLKAAELTKGDNDGNNDEIYALYYKCLQLSPGPTDGTEYKQLKKRFNQLERVLSKETNANK
ncbi:hypothetical protein C8R44DRAFT_855794 [Mycena epipterygia]|nr:hypothetical protein C8R44DRAFT_855794 [Mycena epipterygia]